MKGGYIKTNFDFSNECHGKSELQVEGKMWLFSICNAISRSYCSSIDENSAYLPFCADRSKKSKSIRAIQVFLSKSSDYSYSRTWHDL